MAAPAAKLLKGPPGGDGRGPAEGVEVVPEAASAHGPAGGRHQDGQDGRRLRRSQLWTSCTG